MLIEVAPRRVEAASFETLAVPVRAEAPRDAAGLGSIAARLGALEKGELRSEPGESVVLHGDGGRLVAAGVGDGRDPDDVRWAAAEVAKALAHVGGRVGWAIDPALPLPAADQATAVVEGLLLGGYDPGLWKHARDRRVPEALVFLTDEDADAVLAAARRAAVVTRWANRARDLANEPANTLTPAALAGYAESFAADHAHLSAEALGPDEAAELGMGAFLGVAAGSHQPPRMIVMRHEPPDAPGDLVLGLVGKAITFDTGGISLKPPLYMEDMKGDMAGGGAVITGMAALAELGTPVRAIAVVAATENMAGGGAYRPGDILRAGNGTTIEVLDTDAEGRIVLADALWYARRQGATHIVDFATLTGTMEKALGDLYAGVYGAPAEWRDKVVAAGEASGDHAWPFPLHPRYRRFIDSDFADLKNLNRRGQGGPTYAAEFLRHFAGDGPWAHIDMAGTGFFTYSRGDYLWQRGGTGYGVRLIAELAPAVRSVNLDLTPEHELLRRTVREFAEERVAPVAAELDHEHRFPYELVTELSALGLMGMTIPEEYGGAGSDTVSYAIAVEELTRIDSSVAITVAAHHSLGTLPIYYFGNDEQKREWLPQLTSGERLAAFGLTEADAGSDAGATRTSAELRDGEWVVNGSKMFITNAGTDISGCVTITAITGEGEISNIIVPNGTPGYEISPPMDKLGWRASDTRELSFKDAAVPEANLLGPRGEGFRQFLTILDGGRISVAAMGVGLAQGAYDLAYRYAQERKQFGKPIAKFQAVQFALADMATEIEAGRHLVYRAAWLKDQGRPFALEAAMAKLYTGELSHRAANSALQIHGGYGFMEESAISRLYRDQKILEIGEGTNEVQRMVIARHLGL